MENDQEIKTRKYHRGEKGLESSEQTMIDSKKMERLLQKLSNYFGVQFEKPKHRPVFINKRLKRYNGWFCDERIDIAVMGKWSQKETLWHEVLHGVVRDNWQKLGNDYKNYRIVEKAVFQLMEKGEHGSFMYKLKCQCGWWVKSSTHYTSRHCDHCNKIIVSPGEYSKLKRIAKINSKVVPVNIDRYTSWESNEKIGMDI